VVTVIADVFLRPVVAVNEGGIRAPWFGRLVFEFLSVGILRLDAVLDLLIHGLLDSRLHAQKLRCDASNILRDVSSRTTRNI
jgi:hypothetical protein